MEKTKEQTLEFTELDQLFFEEIFQHEKCNNLTKSDKEKIKIAYDIANRAHKEQERWDGRPYIEHIKRTVMRFLSITKADSVAAEDVIVAILHDTIEDHPTYIPEIRKKFPDSSAYFRVLGLSKPSSAIVTNTYTNFVSAIIRSPELVFRWYWRELEYVRYILDQFFKVKLSDNQIEKQMQLFDYLKNIWVYQKFSKLRDYQNYQFFWMIALLTERDFEIKVADRLDNLDDLPGVDLEYIEKNLISTEVYIKKAETFWRSDLVELLKQWVEKLKKRKSELTETVTSPASSPSS